MKNSGNTSGTFQGGWRIPHPVAASPWNPSPKGLPAYASWTTINICTLVGMFQAEIKPL